MASEPTRGAPPTTALGEAVENAAARLSIWCRAVADLVQADVDRMASGTYQLGDLTTFGVRLMRIGVDNVVQMAGVLSDNLVLLTADITGSSGAQVHELSLDVPVPDKSSGRFVLSSLTGTTPGHRIAPERVKAVPDVFGPDAAGQVGIKVTVLGGGLPKDLYNGTVYVESGGRIVAEKRFFMNIHEVQ